MPNRARSGEVSSPARVVAPISVNFCSGTFTDRALGPLADDDVELVVLERRIEDLLDRRRHPVDLVDEEHFAVDQVGQDRGQVARLLQHRAGGGPDRRAELVGDHVGERGLAEPGRTVEQHVIERFATLAGRGNRHLQVLAHAVLPDVLVERARPQAGFVLRVFVGAHGCDDAVVSHRASSRSACFSVRSKSPPGVALTAASTAFSASGR